MNKDFLVLKNLKKTFNKGEGQIIALDDINLSFPSTGLVSIFGKSGSGKSTLLNILSLIEKPDRGDIFLLEENILNYKEKEKLFYRNQQIGIAFQNHNLLEDETALFNISLPLLIDGQKEDFCQKQINDYLSLVNLDKLILNKKVSLLSGGEKQRISLLRALITSPRILLADEPTGALDEKNSKEVMNILKKYSERHLVILVSHNEELVREYSNEIIYLKEGKIINHEKIQETSISLPIKPKISRKTNIKWINHITLHNLKRRKKRNILSLLGLLVGLSASILTIGFSLGSENAKQNEAFKQADYGVLTLSKEISTNISNSPISLTQSFRPTKTEISSLSDLLLNYEIEANIDYLLPPNSEVYYGEESISNIVISPIYSFKDNYFDHSLIVQGRNPINEQKEVLINEAAYQKLKETLKFDPLNSLITIKNQVETFYKPLVENQDYISDIFSFNHTYRIVGVTDELDFLQTPKVYYSYSSVLEELSSSYLINLSIYLGKPYSWYQRVMDAEKNEDISSYSYRLFCKDISKFNNISQDINKLNSSLKLNSNAVVVGDTFSNLLYSLTLGLKIFLIITIIGTILIVGIVSYSSYSEDKRRSAILSLLGAKKDDIISLYISETSLIGVIAFLGSIVLSLLLQLIINAIAKASYGIANIIAIPFLSFNNIPFVFPLVLFVSLMFVILFSVILPISFSKKISLTEELKSL